MSWKETLTVRGWALRNVFLLFFIKPRVVEISEVEFWVRVCHAQSALERVAATRQ